MKILFRLTAVWVLFLTVLPPAAAGEVLPDPAFRLGGRDFSRAEALQLANGEKNPQRARILIQQNFPLAASIVICSRSGITLSKTSTRESLRENLLLLSPAAREKFLRELSDNNLTPEAWLDRQSDLLENQLNDAVRRWYLQNHAERRQITAEHIQSWYYHHMNIFRRTEVKKEFIWVFALTGQNELESALAALRQGAAPDAVRRQFALDVNLPELLDDLQKHYRQRKTVAPGFEVIKSERYFYLLKENAFRQFYLPLDPALQQAIGNALYDALAKATLAEELQKTFPNGGIEFY